MRRLLLAVAIAFPLYAATPKPELMIPCWAPVIAPAETFASTNEHIVLGGARPATLCSYHFSTTTPDVISVDGVATTESTFTIHLTALAPGDGVLVVTSQAVGGGTYTAKMSTIHVAAAAPCAPGALSVKLPQSLNLAAPASLHIEAQATGTFDRGFTWFVNGVVKSTAPSLDFVPPANGIYAIVVRAESSVCGTFEARTFVVVGPTRSRAVRH